MKTLTNNQVNKISNVVDTVLSSKFNKNGIDMYNLEMIDNQFKNKLEDLKQELEDRVEVQFCEEGEGFYGVRITLKNIEECVKLELENEDLEEDFEDLVKIGKEEEEEEEEEEYTWKEAVEDLRNEVKRYLKLSECKTNTQSYNKILEKIEEICEEIEDGYNETEDDYYDLSYEGVSNYVEMSIYSESFGRKIEEIKEMIKENIESDFVEYFTFRVEYNSNLVEFKENNCYYQVILNDKEYVIVEKTKEIEEFVDYIDCFNAKHLKETIQKFFKNGDYVVKNLKEEEDYEDELYVFNCCVKIDNVEQINKLYNKHNQLKFFCIVKNKYNNSKSVKMFKKIVSVYNKDSKLINELEYDSQVSDFKMCIYNYLNKKEEVK